MRTFKIEILGGDTGEPNSYYEVDADVREDALMIAMLIDQYTPARPLNPDLPLKVEKTVQIELAKQYGKVLN
jgi:hypothetical protein